MKRWISGLLAALFLAGITVIFIQNHDLSQESKVLPAKITADTPIPSPIAIRQSIVIKIDDIPIRIAWAIVNPKEVELYSNLQDQKLSEQIKVDKSCSVLVNGGFYSKENTHLGLFISNFKTVSEYLQSPTFNGFLSIDSEGKLTIGSDFPPATVRLTLQSGPLLIQDNEALPLKINNDAPNRRVVAGKTADGKLIFLTFFRDGLDLQGPLLGKLPDITVLFEQQAGIDIANAINLDGGSASIFISNYIRLNEMSHIGSYFCIK
jgi:exopolysaccharide biosynthesis protein